MSQSTDANLGTRGRLLEVAGEVFAELGFRNATVRDICRRAESNVAAVNYHFGDKERLYSEVVRYADQCASEKQQNILKPSENLSAEQRLHAFIRSILLQLLGQGRPTWHTKLLVSEMVDPTGALDTLVTESFRPKFELLLSIVRELMGDRASPQTVWLCATSVVGQCLHYYHARHLIVRLDPEQKYRPTDIEVLADHITRFSIAALQQQSYEGAR